MWKFIVDNNVGKLGRWLRMMGYNTRLFKDINDARMISIALAEDRVIVTRDTQFIKRGAITRNRVKAILPQSDQPKQQMRQVIAELKLDCHYRPFTICLECNQPLVEKTKEQVAGLVPPYVFKTQEQYMQCPRCHRVYWQGTHWQRMKEELSQFEAI